MTTIQLAVYDLSRGQAAQLSQMILGQRIEGIWHTGVRAYGYEWYFGGGIQISPLGYFERNSQMAASSVVDFGRTAKTEAEIRAYLRTISAQYTASTYNLISNNCNNFSDTLMRFLTGETLSARAPGILELPQTVFSTPMGAMIRPMFEQMQAGINNDPSHTFDPFGGMSNTAAAPAIAPAPVSNYRAVPAAPVATVLARPAVVVRATIEQEAYVSAVASGCEAMAKKLMFLKLPIDVSKAEEEEEEDANGERGDHGPCSWCKRRFDSKAAFDTHQKELPCKTLLSKTASSSPGVTGSGSPRNSNSPKADQEGEDLLSPSEKRAIARAVDVLLPDNYLSNTFQPMDLPSFQTLFKLVLQQDDDNDGNNSTTMKTMKAKAVTPSLFLLRLMVIKTPTELEHEIAPQMFALITQLLAAHRSGLDLSSSDSIFTSVSAQVMGLCTVSNWLSRVVQLSTQTSTDKSVSLSLSNMVFEKLVPDEVSDDLVDVSLAYLSHPRPEIRQTVSALVYNLCLLHTPQDGLSEHSDWSALHAIGEMHGQALQLLCGMLEDVSSEKDATVRRRKLCVALRIVRSHGTVATTMIRELGLDSSFEVILGQINVTSDSNYVDPKSERAILLDLMHVSKQTVVAAAASVAVRPL